MGPPLPSAWDLVCCKPPGRRQPWSSFFPSTHSFWTGGSCWTSQGAAGRRGQRAAPPGRLGRCQLAGPGPGMDPGDISIRLVLKDYTWNNSEAVANWLQLLLWPKSSSLLRFVMAGCEGCSQRNKPRIKTLVEWQLGTTFRVHIAAPRPRPPVPAVRRRATCRRAIDPGAWRSRAGGSKHAETVREL